MRVALIGMDSLFFTPALCETLGKTMGISWVACCDLGVPPDEAEANSGHLPEDLAAKYAVPLYHDLDSLLQDHDLDAAAVATHPGRAPGVLERLAEAGLHLYVVKPAAMDRAGLSVLAKAFERADRIVVSGMTYRLQPGVVSARELVRQGKIGRVSSLRIMHQHGKLSNWPAGSWYRTESTLSPAVYLGWYVVDTLHWLTGERIADVQALGGSAADPDSPYPDTIRAICKMSSGIVASLDVYFGVAWSYPAFDLEVLGTMGAIRIDSDGGALYGGDGKTPLVSDQVDLLAVELQRWAQACQGQADPWHTGTQWIEVLEDCFKLAEGVKSDW